MDKKILIVSILAAVVLLLIIVLNVPSNVEISSFEECIGAGFPAMESYPRQCRTDSGLHFVEEIEEWQTDGVILMQHETEGFLGCFGCGDTLCVDPIQEMKQIEETSERYCSSDFEVVD